MSKFDELPLRPPIEPMETRQVPEIPSGDGWLYEPKWDGFRCVAFRSGGDVELESKSGQSLTRYFPEIVAALQAVGAKRFVVDGELFVESGGGFDFDALLQRIHPAASRVRRLAEETPAKYAVFDLLVDGTQRWYEQPLSRRRTALQAFAARYFRDDAPVVVSPATDDIAVARDWLGGGVARLDGVIAKRTDAPYAFGRRDAVVKIKRRYTADCVVGGRGPEVPPGKTHGKNLGIHVKYGYAGGAAIDNKRDLLIVDQSRALVDVFPPGATVPSQQITGFSLAYQIALNHRNTHLYVSQPSGTVTEVSYPAGTPIDTISQTLSGAFGVATSPDGSR